MKTILPTGLDDKGQFFTSDKQTLIACAGLIGNGGTPAVVLTAAAGSGAGVSIVGNNLAGRITLVSGVLGLAMGKIMTLTLADLVEFPNECVVTFSAFEPNFAGMMNRLYVKGMTNGAELYVTGVALSVSTTYTGNYMIQGR